MKVTTTQIKQLLQLINENGGDVKLMIEMKYINRDTVDARMNTMYRVTDWDKKVRDQLDGKPEETVLHSKVDTYLFLLDKFEGLTQ